MCISPRITEEPSAEQERDEGQLGDRPEWAQRDPSKVDEAVQARGAESLAWASEGRYEGTWKSDTRDLQEP